MAFLTNYTFRKLCNTLNLKKEIDLQTFQNHIYNDANLFYIFNKLELKYLFDYKNLLENDENYIAEYYQNIPEKTDTNTFVFEKPGKLKYHLTNECECLKHDFVDFHIPEDIKELGIEVVEEFRSWFKSQGYAQKHFNGTLKKDVVVASFNMTFAPKFNIKPLNENYKIVQELENTNTYEIDLTFDYNQFKENINVIKKKRSNRFQCEISRKLAKFDWLYNKSDKEITTKISEIYSNQFVENYSLIRLKEIFADSKKLKKELLSNLTAYFKWSYNNESSAIDNNLLNKFGLECCNKCKKN